MLLQIRDGSVSAGSKQVLTHFDFEIRGNEKIAVVGRKDYVSAPSFRRAKAGPG